MNNLPDIEFDERGNPTPESYAAYSAAVEALIDADKAGQARLSWAWLRIRRRPRDGGELVAMASAGTEVAPLSGVVVPPEVGPAEPTAPPQLPGPVSKSALVWDLLVQYGELGRERFAAAAERRSVERAEALPLVRDAQKAVRAARRADPDGKKAETHTAQRQLVAAKKALPQSMAQVVAEGIAATGAAGTAAWFELFPRMTEAAWLWTSGGAAAVTLGGVAWLVDKAGSTRDGLVPTREERALMMRLRTQHWVAHAEARGLGGTLTGNAVLTMAGIEVAVRLDGKWTPKALTEAEDHIRALLGARSTLRMQVEPGSRGGWATLILRTRTAADGIDLVFDYNDQSTWNLGLDTVTGQVVEAPLGMRALIAGKTGAGKSVTARTLLFLASEGPTDVLLIIDLKQVEGRLWDHRARVAFTPAAIIALIEEVMAEINWRLSKMPKGQTDWEPTVEHPRITLVIDEGAEVIKRVKDMLEELESIAAIGRAPAVVLVWMTQKPTMSGTGYGIPSLVAAQMDVRICLRVNTAGEARTVLGDDATGAGFDAHLLPRPGWAFFRGELPDGSLAEVPNRIRVRHMSNKQVVALPDRRIWSRPDVPATAVSGGNAPQLPAAEVPTQRDGGAVDGRQEPGELATSAPAALPAPKGKEATDARVLQLVRAAGRPVKQEDIAEASGVSRASLYRSIGRLIDAKKLAKADDGTLTPGPAADDNA